ncbi:MAG: beta-ribofuranosylaminobenzene 5'-phosphate synthase family protein [Planctomycetota bacterium]
MSAQFESLAVETGSRLHFGLIDPAGSSGRLYAGAGVMVENPGIRLEAELVEGGDRVTADGPIAARVEDFLNRFRKSTGCDAFFNIEISSCPADHLGLGTGTQLGMAIASACSNLLGLDGGIEAIAGRTGRGRRSAIGVHGFDRGGFLIDDGKIDERGLSALRTRIELPQAWRFLLVITPGHHGLSGQKEADCFKHLGAVPSQTVDRLEDLLKNVLVPAAEEDDWPAFSRALHEFGLLAGVPFQEAQGGPFSTLLAGEVAQHLRQAGIEGVGQSSWGPTLYALLPNQQEAETAVAELRSRFGLGEQEVQLTQPRNRGAAVGAPA